MSKKDYTSNFLNTPIGGYDSTSRLFGRRNRRYSKFSFWVLGVYLLILIVFIGFASRPPEITRSTRARDKINSTIETPTEYVIDSVGIMDDRHQAEQAMGDFFQKTGVAPYLIIMNDSDYSKLGDKTIQGELVQIYQDLFDDKDHLLIILLKDGDNYTVHMYAGPNTAGFMDEEAQKILSDCFTRYFYIEKGEVRYADSKFDGDKAVADTFNEAGKRLMRKDWTTATYILVICGCGAGFLVLILIFKSKHRKKGALTIEKEYLPGEYVPQSVMRVSDTDNAARGVKYSYGSQAVAGDLPMGTLLTPDMLHPKMESAVMPSVSYPQGVMLNKRKNGALMPEITMDEVKAPFNDFARKNDKVDESEFLGGSSVTYVDNKGNTVYMNKEDNMKTQFNNWAKSYSAQNGESAFRNEGETPLGSTSVYHDNRGSSVLLKADNKPADTQSQIDKWASYYASVKNESSPLAGEEKQDNWLDEAISKENDAGSELFHL